jgi:hypothetical protein
LYDYGVRTIIDLGNDGDRQGDGASRPAGLDTARLPPDGIEDSEFREFGQRPVRHPPYYPAFLEVPR